MTNEDPDGEFGLSVSRAGDVNGYGIDDFVTGARYRTEGQSYAGRTYIYFGGERIKCAPGVILTGGSSGRCRVHPRCRWRRIPCLTAGEISRSGSPLKADGEETNVRPTLGCTTCRVISSGGWRMGTSLPDISR